MDEVSPPHLRDLPSVDGVLRSSAATPLLARFGRNAVTDAIRAELKENARCARYRAARRKFRQSMKLPRGY